MKFLLTNDDGIDALGLAALERAASELGEVVVVAPREMQSGCSHQTTWKSPMKLSEHGIDRYAVVGTPADCVRIGLLDLVPGVDWVLSGVNEGANLGIDLLMSGTAAAAREAALLGWRAIAFSHYRMPGPEIDWDKATRVTAKLLRELTARPSPAKAFWNVNYPASLSDGKHDFVDCPVDEKPLPIQFDTSDGHYRYCGNYHQRLREPGTDVDVCFSGKISVSQVRLGIS
jgi:5'-nucleotidase